MTLTEMAVVIGIIALMVGLTLPVANVLYNSFESTGGAKSMLNAALESAKSIAIKEHRYAGIRFQKRYDPANPNPLNQSQYIIFIIYDYDKTGLANGFRAVDGIQPIKLPDSIGVMDLIYEPNDIIPRGDGRVDSHSEISNSAIFTDTTSFSIIFSPTGKLVIHDVRVRNRDGFTASTTNPNNLSKDDIFNRISQIQAGYGMFLQDDYYADYQGNPVPNYGLGPESSRNNFIIYDTKKFTQAYKNNDVWNGYLKSIAQNPIYVSPYTGTIIENK